MMHRCIRRDEIFGRLVIGNSKVLAEQPADDVAPTQGVARSPLQRGCIIISSGTCTFSTPMTEAEIDTLVGAYKSGFAKLASMG
jgi:hypothetical protein